MRVNGRTREGRYLHDTERRLVEHCGGLDALSTPQLLLIQQVATDMLRLAQLDERITSGDASDHAYRVASALRAAVRLGLREIGIEKPAPEAKGFSLADLARDIEADKRVSDNDQAR